MSLSSRGSGWGFLVWTCRAVPYTSAGFIKALGDLLAYTCSSLHSCVIMTLVVMMAKVLLLIAALIDAVFLQSVDLTLVPEANGTAVVQACISKLTTAKIFSSDNLMLRRIAFVETRDGTNLNTYRENFHGGIWQLSESRFQQTNSSDSRLQTPINSIANEFDITWSTVQWIDLRRPLYSAIAARLYMILVSTSIPLSVDLSGQASYWVNQYTSQWRSQEI